MLSCQKEKQRQSDEFDDQMIISKGKPFATGEEYVLYVVSEKNDNQNIITYCDSFFCKYIYGLPQRECFIFPAQLSVEKLNEVRLKNLSLLFLCNRQKDISVQKFFKQYFPEAYLTEGDSTIVRFYEHRWAYPQAVAVISAANEEKLLEAISGYSSSLLAFYDKHERKRSKRLVYAKGSNSTQNNHILKTFNVSISVPSGYVNIYQRLNGHQEKILRKNQVKALLWYRLKNESFSSDFMVYSLPYREEIRESEILELRDNLTKHLVHGQNKNSYVNVVHSFYPPVSEPININGLNGLKIIGLWETTGDWMGGPFILFALKDLENNQILIFDGFVYAPGIDKAPLIRRLDIIAHTIRKTR